MDEELLFDQLILARRNSTFSGEGFDVENPTWESLRVLVVGAGGLGCEVLHSLALSGFTNVHVIDMDTIDLSNLNRQFLFRESDIGQPKATVAATVINRRFPWMTVTPHFCKIQEMPTTFYREEIDICILGLDSVPARKWMNQTLANIAELGEKAPGEFGIVQAVPIIDGGTEGFKGSARVVKLGETFCIDCYGDFLYPPTQRVPMCTLESVPRIPEHCVLYVQEKLFKDKEPFGVGVALDGDNAQHISWIQLRAVERQKAFGIAGDIDFRFTQGVVKNVVPAVGFTNALIASMCVNEAVKMANGIGRNLNGHLFYNGSDSGAASNVTEMAMDPYCLSCAVAKMELPFDALPPAVVDTGVVTHAKNSALWNIAAGDDAQITAEVTPVGGEDVTRIVLRYSQSNPLAGSRNEQLLQKTVASHVVAAGGDPSQPFFVEVTGGKMGSSVAKFLIRLVK